MASYYAPFRIVQITDFLLNFFVESTGQIWNFHKFKFKTNLVLTRNIKRILWCVAVAKNQQYYHMIGRFDSKIWVIKYMNFQKGIKLDLICIQMKLMKNKKYCREDFHKRYLYPKRMSTVIKSYVPFTCKSLMVMNVVLVLWKWFYVFSVCIITTTLGKHPSQQVKQIQVPKRWGPGDQRSEHPLSTFYSSRKCSMETSCNMVKGHWRANIEYCYTWT